MKVLSVWAPWAQLLVLGVKDVENRSWSTGYRGPMAIHATQGGASGDEVEEVLADLVEHGMITEEVAEEVRGRVAADRGHIIGVVDVIDCIEADMSASPWAVKGQGNQAIVVGNAKTCERVAFKGGQGLRQLDEEVAEKLGHGGGGSYDLDVAELFGREPRAESNEAAKAARSNPANGAKIPSARPEALKLARAEVYSHKPHGDLPMDVAIAVRVQSADTGEVLYDSVDFGQTFEGKAEALKHGRDWITAQQDREQRSKDLRVQRRLLLNDRLDQVDDAEAKIDGQIKRLRKLKGECEDDFRTLRDESRQAHVDVVLVRGEFEVVDAPSLSEGTCGRKHWGAVEA